MRALKIPEIDSRGLADCDKRDAMRLSLLIISFSEYVRRFGEAYELSNSAWIATVEYVARPETPKQKQYPLSDRRAWGSSSALRKKLRLAKMALRDAALTIFHAQNVLKALERAARTASPAIKQRIDLGMLAAATKNFRRTFPDAVSLRNAVAHAGESERHAAQSSQGEFGAFIRQDLAQGTVVGMALLISPSKGKMKKLELSWHLVSALMAVQAQIHAAITPAAKWSRRRSLRQWRHEQFAGSLAT